MNVLIAGGTGLIGTALAEFLAKQGYKITILSRRVSYQREDLNIRTVRWDGKTPVGWESNIDEADAVINLAGASIGGGLWTTGRKRIISESRLDAGQAIVNAILQAKHKPKVLLQISGTGYYPSDTDAVFYPSSPPGKGFMPETAVLWENSTREVERIGIRRVVLRTSPVLSAKGGFLSVTKLPFEWFVGGPLGSGNQWWPWIHIDDAVAAIAFILENSQVDGIIHLTSPNPLRMKEFGKILAKVLNRPFWIPVPGFAIKLVLGEMSKLVLEGQQVYPDDLENAGYKFKYPELEPALKSLLK